MDPGHSSRSDSIWPSSGFPSSSSAVNSALISAPVASDWPLFRQPIASLNRLAEDRFTVYQLLVDMLVHTRQRYTGQQGQTRSPPP
jgi:hypothetical protein